MKQCAPTAIMVFLLILMAARPALAQTARPPRYPEFVLERIFTVEAVPSFRTVTSPDGIAYVWLDLKSMSGVVTLAWDRRGGPPASKKYPMLARRLSLDTATRYTFELFSPERCDSVRIDYPFEVGEYYLLRVLRGAEVVFDSGASFSEGARGSELPPGVKPASEDEALVPPLSALLERWIEGGATKELIRAAREQGGKPGRASAVPVVLGRQPQYENALAVLVFDPQARGQKRAAVTIFEGICADELAQFNKPALLGELGASGIFVGRAPVEGSHSTIVQVRYRRVRRDGGRATYASGLEFMAFH